MKKTSKALILVNIGTPDKPELGAVRRYLSQFLNDHRVIDIPWLGRKLLVNGIIVPFRAKKSTKLYRRLWTDNGSPLLIYLNALAGKLQEVVGENITVFGAMRYGNPSLDRVLEEIKKKGFDEVVIFSLFPQYASSTTGSVAEKVMKHLKQWNVIPSLRIISQYYKHPAFISAFVKKIRSYNPEAYDRILFSYHGLPIRQIEKVHPEVPESGCTCQQEMPGHGRFCYKAACYETTRILANELELPPEKYMTSFQSRLSNKWLKPFSDEIIKEMAEQGVQKLLVVAPSFVADCLETTIELGEEYKQLFTDSGGRQLTLVESLNSDDNWAEAIKAIVED